MIDAYWAQDEATNRAIEDWVTRIIWPGEPSRIGECTCMGVLDGARPIAGMVYHNYQPNEGTIELSGAAVDRRWMTRPVIEALFSYPFDYLDLQLVVTRNSADNSRSALSAIASQGCAGAMKMNWSGH